MDSNYDRAMKSDKIYEGENLGVYLTFEERKEKNREYMRNRSKLVKEGKWFPKVRIRLTDEERKERVRQNSRRKRAAVFNHYSNGKVECVCCGEKMFEFLSIDHINNDGAKHRREIHTENLAGWLIKNNFPQGFQVMCMNCNCGKFRNKGVCPHNGKM